jgi:hypothetical protein
VEKIIVAIIAADESKFLCTVIVSDNTSFHTNFLYFYNGKYTV